MSASKRKLRTGQPFAIPAELEPLMTSIDKVRPLEGNARRGDLEAIKASIRAHGLYRAPVARRETGEVLVNNHTTIACRELGATAIPIDWRSIADDDAARDIALADNRTSDLATYDREALAAMLERAGEHRAQDAGFDAKAYTELVDRAEQAIADPEPIAPPAKPRTRKGRVLELGPHRLICGDARDPKILDRLLAGETADMVWTDPPYGVDLGPLAAQRGRDHGDMAGDALEGDALEAFLEEVLRAALERTKPGGALYCAAPSGPTFETFARAVQQAGWSWRQTLAWVKDSMVLGRQDYQWRHESIFYGWRPGAHRWYGGFDKTTVIENPTRQALEALEHADLVEIAQRLIEGEPGTVIAMARPRVAVDHPTIKPAGLVAGHIRNSAKRGGLVLDPFAGSGTTLVAAEQTGRRAALVELEPAYCDVIRRRYEEIA